MTIAIESQRTRVWSFIVWPPIVLNVGSLLIVGGMYAFRYMTTAPPPPEPIQIGQGQIQFALSVFIFVVEWSFAFWLLYTYRKAQASLRALFSHTGALFTFRRGPAVLLFVLSNALFAAYMRYLMATMPDLNYRDMSMLQSVLFIALIPVTAAFTEELIWRGHIITCLERRGNRAGVALLISALSFALIHGIFLPERLLVTFLLGIITGMYYIRERALLPLMLTHWFMDVWSYGIFVLR